VRRHTADSIQTRFGGYFTLLVAEGALHHTPQGALQSFIVAYLKRNEREAEMEEVEKENGGGEKKSDKEKGIISRSLGKMDI